MASLFLGALLLSANAVALHVGPTGSNKLRLPATRAALAPHRSLVMETGKQKSSKSGMETKTAERKKQLRVEETKKEKKSETQKRMKGSDGDDNERDEEFAENYKFPPKFNVLLLQDEEYEKTAFTKALCDVVEGMKPKRAQEIFSKLKTDDNVFVCAEHRERAEFYVEQLARKTPMIFAEARETLTGDSADEVDDKQKRFRSSRN